MFIILSFYKDFNFLCVCVCILASECASHSCRCPSGGQEGVGCPGTGAMGGCECTNTGPLQQTGVLLLATECNRESC